MKIVVGGATSVGRSLVGYLSLGNNDIIVVDENPAKLDELAKEYDVQPVLGSISHPDIQENLGMKSVDMLIAVTDSDEINMIACQVAYSLFNVPRKIARVDSKYFLNPLWNTLYNEKSLPIDLVITPDIEIAKFIFQLINLPGSTAVFPFLNNKINLFAFRLRDIEIPFIKFSLRHINNKLADISARIALIIRGNRRILSSDEDVYLQRNDLIYICCPTIRNMEVMRLFAVDHNPYQKIVMFGANSISQYLAGQIEEYSTANCNIIEDNYKKARRLAEILNQTTVITGEMMSDVTLEDAGFYNADLSIALTDRDKDNLLISLLSTKNKDMQAISLVNSRDYNVLAANIRNNVIIDHSVITASSILQYLRKTRLQEAYSLGRDLGEVWEIRLGNDSANLGRTANELKIPADSSIIAITHQGELIYQFADYALQPEDKLLVYVSPSDIRRIESIFYY